MAIAGYTVAWAALLTSGLAAPGGPLTFPPLLAAVAAGMAIAHIALGYAMRTYAVLSVALIPPLLALSLAPWLPHDPDIPRYPATLALALVLAVTPSAAALAAVGVAAAKRFPN